MKKLGKGLCMSFGMFSVIPVPHLWDSALFHLVIPFLPLVGGVIGGLWYGFSLLLTLWGAPPMLFGSLLLFFPLFLSGFIHIDGFMDTCDAVFSRAPLEKKRQILKDSHVGAFAVIGLCALLLLSFAAAYTGIAAQKNLLALIFLPILSRCISGFVLLTAPISSGQGFAASFRTGTGLVHRAALLVLALLCLAIGFFAGGTPLLLTLVGLCLCGICAALFVLRELKEISGDLCGFIITTSEFAGLLLWALL